MIVPDINLLVYAYNIDAPLHLESKLWWEGLINNQRLIGIPWVVVSGFIRLMTHPSVLTVPLSPGQTIGKVREWLNRDSVEILDRARNTLTFSIISWASWGWAADLTTDAHLAAIAIEYPCEIHSNDVDFARFPGLRWINPLTRRFHKSSG